MEIKRYVALRRCPKDCKDENHKNEFIVHYHIPFIGVVSGLGVNENEADKAAKQIVSEKISIFYTSKLKEMINIEKLLEFK